MIKKIAKKSLLILLLFIITIYGVLTPFKQPFFENTAHAFQWIRVQPIEGAEETGGEASATGNMFKSIDRCHTCFVAVKTTTIFNMLFARLDTSLSLIPRMLVYVSKWIVIMFANILEWIMVPEPNSTIYEFSRVTYQNGQINKDSIIYWIWSTSLYYANIMITLFLIWTAINIILEKKEYISYHSLTKLLIVALLINFSLVICTLFVDISNYLAALFMSGIQGDAFSCTYACVIHKVANMFNCISTKMIFSQTLSNSIALMVAIIFIGQLIGLILFTLMRMIFLWFLVGVSPIAIVLSAIPDTQNFYKQWKEIFLANLIKLPALAFASYFIMNIMMYIANKTMLNQITSGQILIHTITIVFMLIILSQGLMMVAQSLGVTQITKATNMVTGWAKKGWDSIRSPATSWGKKQVMGSGLVKKALARGANSKYAPIAKMSNNISSQFKKEQAKSQKELSYWKDNGNYGVLANTVAQNAKLFPGDKTKFVQAMQLISQGEADGNFDDKQGILKNKQYMIMLKNIMNDKLYSETEAGKALGKKYAWIKDGPNLSKDKATTVPTLKEHYENEARLKLTVPGGPPPTAKQIEDEVNNMVYFRPFQKTTGPDDAPVHKKLMQSLTDRASDKSKAAENDWMTDFSRFFDAAKDANNPSDFLLVFYSLLKSFNVKHLKNIFLSIHKSQRGEFWNTLAKMAVVANLQRQHRFPAGTVEDALNNVTPAQIKGSGADNAVQALADLAGANGSDNWMRGGKDSFKQMLFNNQFIN